MNKQWVSNKVNSIELNMLWGPLDTAHRRKDVNKIKDVKTKMYISSGLI
jgi:hypothetical protein